MPSTSVEITFLRAVGGPNSFTVPASSVCSDQPSEVERDELVQRGHAMLELAVSAGVMIIRVWRARSSSAIRFTHTTNW